MTEFLTAAQAAQRLGVKPATLYAYVSRGILSRDKSADGRGSLFEAGEVERLARRGRPRRPAGATDITVESAITEIAGDRLRYRGHDVTRLAVERSFEDVAELLWTGGFPPAESASEFDTPRQLAPWQATPAATAAGRAAQAALPAGTLPLERFQVIVPAMAATDPLRLNLDPPAVRAAGRSIIAGLVDCLPAPPGPVPPGRARPGPASPGPASPGPVPAGPARPGPASPGPARPGPASPGPGLPGPALLGAAPPGAAPDEPIADRLWWRLCDRRPSPALRRALSAALVLLADHELAASTLAARVAASVRADPYAVVATGMGVMSGALHGGASLGAEALLAAAASPEDVPRVVGELLRRGEKVPGFGHSVYRAGDPRATFLLGLVRRAAPKSAQLAVAEAVLAEVRRKSLPAPNMDLAIATMARVAGMIRGSGEAVFAVARTAGWIAHALEAYAGPGPLRLRAVYTGRAAAIP